MATPPDPISPTDASQGHFFDDLLRRAADGDPNALGDLAAHYEPRVRTVARVLLGRALRPYLDSVDLVQSVHESLLLGVKAGKFEFANEGKLVALAVLMTRRKVAEHWRKLQRQHRMSLVGHADASDLADLVSTAVAPQPVIGAEMKYREAVERLCQQLTPDDQQLLTLRLEGLDTKEIAQRLNVSDVAARVRLTRLRQRLQSSGVSADCL